MSIIERKPRSDGVRNRAALLAAADAVFAGAGAAAPLTAVAARAGVAIGTLYKHFPTRRALVAALLAERHEALFAHELGDTAESRLEHWVRLVTRHAATYRGLAELMATDLAVEAAEPVGTDESADALTGDCARLAARTDDLVSAARAAGRLGHDIGTEDVVTLMNAAAWIRAQDGATRSDRLITAALRGMGLGRPTRA